MSRVDELWTKARNRDGLDHALKNRLSPTPAMRAILVTLLNEGSTFGSELARRARLHQGNTTALRLPQLARYGFVESWPDETQERGGKQRRLWDLTASGRYLAQAIREEMSDHPRTVPR